MSPKHLLCVITFSALVNFCSAASIAEIVREMERDNANGLPVSSDSVEIVILGLIESQYGEQITYPEPGSWLVATPDTLYLMEGAFGIRRPDSGIVFRAIKWTDVTSIEYGKKRNGKARDRTILISASDAIHPPDSKYKKVKKAPGSIDGHHIEIGYAWQKTDFGLDQKSRDKKDLENPKMAFRVLTKLWQAAKNPSEQKATTELKTNPSQGATSDLASELRALKALLDEGLITPAEYEKKKAQILGL